MDLKQMGEYFYELGKCNMWLTQRLIDETFESFTEKWWINKIIEKWRIINRKIRGKNIKYVFVSFLSLIRYAYIKINVINFNDIEV